MDQQGLQRIFGSLATATAPANNVGHVHLLLHSTGGSVSDSVCLYNFLRVYPIDLTAYDSGTLASGAVLAFLGAKKRKASASATFMLHRTTGTAQAASAGRLHTLADSVELDDRRTEAILSGHITLSNDQWLKLEHDLFLSADDALKVGLIHEIGDFSPPPGTQIFYI
jgi:ATP-dependent Clp protease protease subunit